MGRPSRTRDGRRPATLLCSVAADAAVALAAPPGAMAANAVSSNWAGYVVRPPAGKRLRSVSGTWTEPAVSCTPGHAGYSAVWVGLGGYRRNASSLEQIGTDSDCTRSGRAVYSSWVELLPAAPSALRLKVRPGDQITASVTVIGRDATLGIRDLSTGERVSRTVRLMALDVSSAEWIIEAPSDCATSGSCHTLPLADFGKVAFTSATATIGARTSTIEQGGWTTTALQMRAGRGALAEGATEGRLSGAALLLATPSAASRASGAFTVAFGERGGEAGTPEGPTLPGFSGGPPG
jgi:hypothetical protein